MLSLRTQAEATGSTSMRGLRDRLATTNLGLRRILQVAELHGSFQRSGGALGPLGAPTRGVSFAGDGSASRDYRGGTLTIQGEGGEPEWSEALKVRIDYVGCRCNDESDELSDSDEPYFILSVVGPRVAEVKMVGPISMDDGDESNAGAGPVAIDLTPNELLLSTVIRENDAGSPDEAKGLILSRVKELALVAGTIYTVVAGDGGEGASDTGWVDNVPAVGTVAGWMASLFGMGDDNVGSDTKRLFTTFDNTRPPRTEDLGPRQFFRGNEYNYVTNEIGSADQGRYEVFYMISLYNRPFVPPPQPV